MDLIGFFARKCSVRQYELYGQSGDAVYKLSNNNMQIND